ncbi:hypothetical protein [Pelagicoccus sp. SDUM812003]|uniref:hypothetical protein n=1 Tax=Pelagicoccus sp. SDUM812003 TaxID=3041267 RepID=UPI00280FACAD|nr:hypothetical protein [Pelagicoccus sp. SDUM812003]MDQ8203829.1 hypothetical protein [Pelagicoccus sp. SDUM812003]
MKNKLLSKALLIGGITLAGVIATSCSSEPESSASTENAPQLQSVILDTAPSGALSVEEARQKAVPGQPIVVTGQIGAAHDPFSKSYASFILGDKGLDYCNERPGDNCGSPWDACCEPKEKIAAMRASVQVLADGEPVAQSLKGVGGLTELDEVVIAGVVDPASTPQNLIINASGIYRAAN